MATTLPSPGEEQKIDKEAEGLRHALGVWAQKPDTKFQKQKGWENLEDCVDSNRWMHAAPFLVKVGLQKEGYRMAILRVTGTQSQELKVVSDCAYVISLKESEQGEKESEQGEKESEQGEIESEQGKIICKTTIIDLDPGYWLAVYPPARKVRKD